MPIITLRQMKAHEKGRIVKVRGGGEINRRLRDMGLVPGTEILVQGRAPLYDPVNLKIRGNNLTLRNNEADWIEVDVEREE
ncbi:MAG: FeoA domain-containing protein [Thermodesulfobacteriota bacterium]